MSSSALNEQSLEKETKMIYRAKLHELCQKKRFQLPKYSYTKDGPDHNARFKASVTVNRINFDSETICKSSKEAYNEAAKLAFLYFTSEEAAGIGNKESLHGHKLRLQIYAQKKNLGVPTYHHCTTDEHFYKATVTIAGQSFESLELSKELEDAEASAAQAALLSLSVKSFRENVSYKSFLQKLAQAEGFFLPTYTTVTSGVPHDQTFISTVEVEGETFDGNEAKSKEQAELNAAMVAYNALMERNRTKYL